ncbi:HAD family hydrolase [Bacteroides sp. 51]|uniref:HAD family hydrolase n=1 Tax=Bacteroides sp. 51 TaxID=2302938 RepID=UPI0013CF8498|nr:HAD-IA family hydrolase [Bacteroides sp. 51]NDV84465.1 HAD family hydrolase [Bacteroides sp. 51]
MKYKAVLFDFDYTLADSSRGIVTCFQQVLKRHGYTDVADETIKRTIGKTLEDSFSILTGETNAEQLENWRKEYVKEADTYMTVNTHIYPDTLEVLEYFKANGAKVGIISTKYRFRILEFFGKYLPEGWFDVIVGGEDVTKHKPDPQGVTLALERLGISSANVLYVGDSVVDGETAKNSGVDFIGVTTGMTMKEELERFPHIGIIPELKNIIPLTGK